MGCESHLRQDCLYIREVYDQLSEKNFLVMKSCVVLRGCSCDMEMNMHTPAEYKSDG
jgi:hypothetical protein